MPAAIFAKSQVCKNGHILLKGKTKRFPPAPTHAWVGVGLCKGKIINSSEDFGKLEMV